jgi:hypothetical protein
MCIKRCVDICPWFQLRIPEEIRLDTKALHDAYHMTVLPLDPHPHHFVRSDAPSSENIVLIFSYGVAQSV